MPRLFTAIRLPANVAHQLSLWGGGLNGARWIDWANMHITLCYLGEVEVTRLHELHRVLEQGRSGPIPIRLSHLDVFGSKKPRSLYFAVQNNEILRRFQSEQESRLRHAGFELEKRKYVPHVTLARLVNVKANAMASYLQMRGRVEPIEFTAHETMLLSSRQSRGGGPYCEEAIFDLNGLGQRKVCEAHHPMLV